MTTRAPQRLFQRGLLLWCLCAASPLASALSREPIFYGDYGIEAAANLSSYRSNFLATIMPLFDDERKAWYHNQSGHARWEDFYKTHITCPPGKLQEIWTMPSQLVDEPGGAAAE
jgi:hypothetical protein